MSDLPLSANAVLHAVIPALPSSPVNHRNRDVHAAGKMTKIVVARNALYNSRRVQVPRYNLKHLL